MSTKVNFAVKHMPRNIIPEHLLIFRIQYFFNSWNVCGCCKTGELIYQNLCVLCTGLIGKTTMLTEYSASSLCILLGI